jgi:hypothetical protein
MQDVRLGKIQKKASCEIFQGLITRPIIFKKREKNSQDPGYFAEIHQEYLSSTCMINQYHYRWAR